MKQIDEPWKSAFFSRLTLFILAATGLSINLMLLARRLGDDAASLAGCGPGSGCETVLGSQWSQVLGIPVTLPGVLVYASVMLGITRDGRHLLAPFLGAIFAAIAWFVFVQAILIRAFCPWCMAAHIIGLCLIILGLPYAAQSTGSWRRTFVTFFLFTILSATLLIAIQWLGPKPATHRLTEIDSIQAHVSNTHDTHALGNGRIVNFFDGRKAYRVHELPHIGSPNAPHVLVEYFDYACGACRTMSAFLDALVATYPDEICVIMLPMPLDRECNPALPPLEPGHPGACQMARASLAIWRNSPDDFHPFHTALFADPSAENATMLASALLPNASIAMRDPWVNSIISANITDWQVISTDNAKLPKLILRDRRIMHGFPPTESEFIYVIARELGLAD